MDSVKSFFNSIFKNQKNESKLKQKQQQWQEKLGRNLDTKCMICFKDISEIHEIWCEPKP